MDLHAFEFGRINFANGDMVGHTGNFHAAIRAVEAVDTAVGRLMTACERDDYALLVTADHGNCDEMFEGEVKDYPNWKMEGALKPRPKTAHTRNPVPLYLYNLRGNFKLRTDLPDAGLANMANTFLVVMGLAPRSIYLPAVIERC
jgi:2,3-bisphosphoglycerate-independent phosphoglycerate mutase